MILWIRMWNTYSKTHTRRGLSWNGLSESSELSAPLLHNPLLLIQLMDTQTACSFDFFFKIYLFIFRQREGREKERERNINVWLPLPHPLLGAWPATQACALTGNRTSHPLVRRPALNPLSHTSQGCSFSFFSIRILSQPWKQLSPHTQPLPRSDSAATGVNGGFWEGPPLVCAVRMSSTPTCPTTATPASATVKGDCFHLPPHPLLGKAHHRNQHLLNIRYVPRMSSLKGWVLPAFSRKTGITTLTLEMRTRRLQEANSPRTVPKSAHLDLLCSKSSLICPLGMGGPTEGGRKRWGKGGMKRKLALGYIPARVVAKERDRDRQQKSDCCPGLFLPLRLHFSNIHQNFKSTFPMTRQLQL